MSKMLGISVIPITTLFYEMIHGDSGDLQVRFAEESGGFPGIVHGGITTAAALHAHAILLPELSFPGFEATIRLSGALSPGGSYAVRLNNPKGLVDIFPSGALDGKSLAWLTCKNLDGDAPPPTPAYLPNILDAIASPTGSFHCIDPCVAFGARNSIGLGCKVFYHLSSEDKRLESVWTSFQLREPAQVLMTLDELGWWMGALLTRVPGVTTKIVFRSFPMASEISGAIKVFAVRPNSIENRPGRLQKISLHVLTEDRTTPLTADVFYMLSQEHAESGMAGEGVTFLDDIRKQVFGSTH